MSTTHSKPHRPLVARLIRTLSIPIILFWVLLAVALGMLSPSLDAVADKHSVSLAPHNSPAFEAMMNIGAVFKQFDSDSTAMIVLEGQDKLGEDAHDFYNKIVTKLNADHAHVENVQDFWSDPLTAAGSQSPDGKAAYVQVFLVGAQGTTPSHESVAAVRDIVASVPSPPGVKAYVAGNTVVVTDTSVTGHKSMALMALVSIGVILVMLLMVYRSVVTTMLALLIVGIELFAAQGVTATAGNLDIIGLTPYAVSMVTMLSIAAGTDYVIFLLGRYHEARAAGQDREEAYYAAYHGVSHVILGSGLTIAGACLCLILTTLPYFNTMGLPCAISLVVIVAAALTLAPAILVVGSRFGLLDPKRELSTRGWRKVGTAVVRWPVPIIVVTVMIAIIGFVGLLTYVPQYNDDKFTPADMPANVAMTAAERHFSKARMNPELLMLEPNSRVRVGDVNVGTVTQIERQGWHALVSMRINGDVQLPANVTAKMGQTSLLGSEHVELAAPTTAAPQGHLHDGSVIPLQNGGAYPTTEQTLAAVSLLLNGGGVGQLQDVVETFSTALRGRAQDLRSLLEQLDKFVAFNNAQTGDIIDAQDSLNRVVGTFADQKPVVDRALKTIPDALAVLRDERQNLADSLDQLGKFSAVAADSVNQTKENLVKELKELGPVIHSLADAGPALTRSLSLLTTFPFPNENLEKWMRGDYANLSAVFDLTLSRLDSGLFTGTRFEGDLTQLELQWGRTIGQMPSPYTAGNPLIAPYHLDQGR